jgi:hypothetical protein
MEHLVLSPSHLESVALPPVEDHINAVLVTLPSLRSDENIGEILNDSSKDHKGEDSNLRICKAEDFLMLDNDFNNPNPLQSACTMCTTCKRVLVFPITSEDPVQCPACKKLVDAEEISESKLLRNCPQCETLLGELLW